MMALLRAILALLASLGQQPAPPADPAQPVIITPAGPPQFCEPGKPWCK